MVATVLPSTRERRPVCTQASHAALKSSPLWKLLRLDGYQRCEADEFGPAEVLEYRTCMCGSTLAVTIREGE